MTTIFDIGAHKGNPLLDQCLNNENLRIFAFEPNPELCLFMKNKTENCDRYHIIEAAVDLEETIKRFYIRKSLACSGLNKKKSGIWSTLPKNHKGQDISEIDVRVVTLESFIEQNNVESIDHMQIDTEGNDLRVLQSMGKYLDILKSGAMEVAKNEKTLLYENQPTFDEVQKYLNDNNFTVVSLLPHGEYLFDVFFLRT